MFNFVFDFEMFKAAIVLLVLILTNVLLGSYTGFLNREFDFIKLRDGFFKGVIVGISFIALYFCGQLIPDVSFEVLGQEVTILMGISLILFGGIYLYGKQVFEKIIALVGVKTISKV